MPVCRGKIAFQMARIVTGVEAHATTLTLMASKLVPPIGWSRLAVNMLDEILRIEFMGQAESVDASDLHFPFLPFRFGSVRAKMVS